MPDLRRPVCGMSPFTLISSNSQSIIIKKIKVKKMKLFLVAALAALAFANTKTIVPTVTQ